mgnify:CR=1 FL=1
MEYDFIPFTGVEGPHEVARSAAKIMKDRDEANWQFVGITLLDATVIGPPGSRKIFDGIIVVQREQSGYQ